jgi:hypothetical protein
VDHLAAKFDNYITRQETIQDTTDERLKDEMKNLKKLTKEIAQTSGGGMKLYIVLGALGVICVLGFLLLTKAKKLEKVHVL